MCVHSLPISLCLVLFTKLNDISFVYKLCLKNFHTILHKKVLKAELKAYVRLKKEKNRIEVNLHIK